MSQTDKKIAILESKIRKLEKANTQKEEVIQAQIQILDDYRRQIVKQDIKKLNAKGIEHRVTGCSVCPLYRSSDWGPHICNADKDLEILTSKFDQPLTPVNCPLNEGPVTIKKLK